MTRHAAFAARRGGARSVTWWGRAWLRGVEETAYEEGDLRAGWRLARAGVVGGISVSPGEIVAAVSLGEGESVTSSMLVPVLAAIEVAALVETVGAETGRMAALLAGDLPASLSEHAEEAGVELVPSSFEASCTCDAWVQPCAHALAVLAQVTWLLDADPLVLFELRGLPREELMASVATLARPTGGDASRGDAAGDGRGDDAEVDLELAEEAATRAARLLKGLG